MDTEPFWPKFEPGCLALDPDVLDEIDVDQFCTVLYLHFGGIWDEMHEEQRRLLETAASDGQVMQSVFLVRRGLKLLVRTESDRSKTTMKLARKQ